MEAEELEKPKLVVEVKRIMLLAIPLFLSSASWVRYPLAPLNHLITCHINHVQLTT